MIENKITNDSEDIILGIPAINGKNEFDNAYDIGKGWPHYKDFDLSDKDFEFMGEAKPFFAFESNINEFSQLYDGNLNSFPQPLEIESNEFTELNEFESEFNEYAQLNGFKSEPTDCTQLNEFESGFNEYAELNGFEFEPTDCTQLDKFNAFGLTQLLESEATDFPQFHKIEKTEFSLPFETGINTIQSKENSFSKDNDIRLWSMEQSELSHDYAPTDFDLCDLDELHVKLCRLNENSIYVHNQNLSDNNLYTHESYKEKEIDICGLNAIDNSLYSQDGYDKNNYSDAVITGFNLDLSAGSTDLDIVLESTNHISDKKDKKIELISQINKRLSPFVKHALSANEYKTCSVENDKQTISSIVDNIMDKLQSEIDEAEDISLEVQRTDWSRYRLLRSLTELLVVMELEN